MLNAFSLFSIIFAGKEAPRWLEVRNWRAVFKTV